MGICICKIIHDSFLHPVFPFRELSSHINANYAYKNRSYYSVWEYVVTELFLITSFLHLIFLFLRLRGFQVEFSFKCQLCIQNRSFYDVWGICSYRIIHDYFFPSSSISILRVEFSFKCKLCIQK